MKKGDLRKQEILRTAECLFCRNGYEQTSIQDILDQLKSSKGSFYHHFVSKEALLETLCARRAELNLEMTDSFEFSQLTSAEKLDHLLTGMFPLQGEKLSFFLMLLPTFILPVGSSVKTSYCESLKNAFFPAVSHTIKDGVLAGEMFCGDPDVYADAVITLINRLWMSVCDMIIKNESEGKQTDLSELLHFTEQYRTAVEKMLCIAYGSLVLIDIPALRRLTDQIHIHWAKPTGKQ